MAECPADRPPRHQGAEPHQGHPPRGSARHRRPAGVRAPLLRAGRRRADLHRHRRQPVRPQQADRDRQPRGARRVRADDGRRRHPPRGRRPRPAARRRGQGGDQHGGGATARTHHRGVAAASARSAWCFPSRPSSRRRVDGRSTRTAVASAPASTRSSGPQRGVELGAGEILVTSIDREGTRKGFDVALTRAIAETVPVPVIASGGYGAPEHLLDVVRQGQADAVAFADALHYGRTTMPTLRGHALAAGLNVRKV